MYTAFNRSNFQQEIFELYHDLITFGTAAMFIEEDDEDNLKFSTRHINEIYISENDKGRINLVSKLFYTPRGDSSTIIPQSFPLINSHQAINPYIINNSGVTIEDENYYKFEIIRTRLCL